MSRTCRPRRSSRVRTAGAPTARSAAPSRSPCAAGWSRGSSCACRAARSSRPARPRARTSCAPSSTSTTARAASASSRSWTPPRASARPTSSSATRSSTRTPRRTSPSAPASPGPSRTCRRTSAPATPSTSRRRTSTSWSARRTSRSTASRRAGPPSRSCATAPGSWPDSRPHGEGRSRERASAGRSNRSGLAARSRTHSGGLRPCQSRIRDASSWPGCSSRGGVRADGSAPSWTFAMGGTGIRHFTHLARRAACALAVVAASLAGAAGAAGASAAPAPGADCQALPARTCLGAAFAPGDQSAGVLANLGSPTSPEEDLTQALSDLAAAPDADAAARARGRALAILEGSATPLAAGDETFLDDKAYKGIALLGTQAKVQDVAAGTTTVDVREVRFGDHALLDTSMLRFADMGTPFTIRWHVTELGTSFGGVLSPAAVPASGDAQNAVLQPLGLPGLMMGTHQANRFNPGGLDEETRLATQVFTVGPMTPGALVGGGILAPNIKAGREPFAQIAVGAAAAAPPDVPATVADIAAEAPARQLHDDLDALHPADPGFLDAAKAKGAQDGDLVGAMMSRDTLPKPAAASASADVSVQFANGEAYVSKRALRVAPGSGVTFSVTNLDGVDHDFAVRQLHDRAKVDPL